MYLVSFLAHLWYDNNIVEADTSEEQKGGETQKVHGLNTRFKISSDIR